MDEHANLPAEMTPRRRVFIIDREYQWRYLSTWLIMTLAYVLIILVVLWVGLQITRETSVDPESITVKKLSDLLRYNAIFIILLTFFMGLVTVLLSHRVAGPAYRFCKSLRRMIAGDYNFEVKLRKNDYLQDVATNLNALLARLRDREEKLKRLDADADRLMEAVQGRTDLPQDVREGVERITLGLDSIVLSSSMPEVKPMSAAEAQQAGNH
ncbi:MAG: methyl-accepting chemotaxis protein [Planctomycetes bacterium]|nr:methyl-accepting chemotaxis protein [Planctomycetota bacterium]